MDLSDKKMLAAAIGRLSSTLGVSVDPTLREAYLKGEHPTLLGYEKLEKSAPKIPIINKYLLGVDSYLAQPSAKIFYDIFRVGRIVPLAVVLDQSISTLAEKKVGGYQDRLAKLIRETAFDGFEAVLFELAVAAKYAKVTKIGSTSFIKEKTDRRQPDFETASDSGSLFVECKKPDRRNDASIAIRNAIVPKAQRSFKMLAKNGISTVIELTLNSDPQLLDEVELKDMVFESLEARAPILNPGITVYAKPIAVSPLKDLALFPSPGYFYDHFGFDPNGEWHGLIPCLEGHWASPSWLDDVRWQCAVKWKVTNEDILWKIKRLGYSLIFKGMEQLNQAGNNTILHLWFERDRALGHRKKELMHFFETLKERDRDWFSWMIFNEVSPSLSPVGRFDFVEYSHPISGPGRRTEKALVTNIFVSDEDTAPGLSEFGVGHPLPPIDQDDENWKRKAR